MWSARWTGIMTRPSGERTLRPASCRSSGRAARWSRRPPTGRMGAPSRAPSCCRAARFSPASSGCRGGMYGQRHLRMTAKAFNFSRWLDSEGRRVPKELHSAHVMGWTPQILSVRALDEMEAELVARVPVAADPGREPLANATFRRLSNSTQWTEYFTYHLALDALGAWGRYHENMCAARGTRIEPSSGRCVSELTDAALGGADEPARVLGALAIAPNASRSFALPGCLKVRVDCVQELLLEQGHSVVPFITINDHKVTGEQAVRAVRAKLDDHTPRPSRSVSLRPPAHRCCGMNFVLWRNVFGPLSFPTVRTFDAACGS
ncbi:hypothetical protein T492DRAFT_206053 [Pavlovales sp. CCMP2436]|nr:hypothetical protein T492DRAFT_206053 [Pavlovales sp. CCMP2436]